MQFADLQYLFNPIVTELICDDIRQFEVGDLVRIKKQNDSDNAYIAPISGLVTSTGKFATKSHAEEWISIQEGAYFASVAQINGKRLTLSVATGFFIRELGRTLDIAVTDSAINPNIPGYRDFNDAKAHIESEYTVCLGKENYVVVAKHLNSNEKTLSFVNGTRIISAVETSKSDCGVNDEQLASQKVFAISKGEAPFRREANTLELWKCTLRICDATSAHQADVAVKAFLDKNLEKYLSTWRKYTTVEYDFVRGTAEKAGVLEYALLDNGIDGREITVKVMNPEYINTFQSKLDDLGSDRAISVSKRGSYGTARFPLAATLVSIDADKKEARLRFKFAEQAYQVAEKGEIRPNIRAAEVQYERRESAFTRIFERRSAKPQLAMLISGQDAGHKQEKRKMTPLNDSVIARCFKGRTPTDAQKEAISIALNTPDFAIIQGPPGTGKTTVINAIMTALSDKEKDPELFFGKNLMTAYQKDATAHLAEQLRVYGLPVITFKGKTTFDDGNNEVANDDDRAIATWISEKSSELEASEENAKEYADIDALVAKLKLLSISFDPNKANREMCKSLLLAYISDLTPFCCDRAIWRGEQYLDKAKKLLSMLEIELLGDELTVSGLRFDRQIAGNIPTSKTSMEDAGLELLNKAIRHFSSNQYPEVIRQISSALKSTCAGDETDFSKVRILKNRLLTELRNKSGLLPNDKLNKEAVALIESTVKSIESAERSDEDRIMADYLRAFADEDTIRESIMEFMTVISATHQKAISHDVQSRKNADQIDFENVLIDEAARSCPPDLLIPLSCARDRMILVGDHKQLPQFVSDKVYDAIDDIASTDKQSIIKDKPMFLHLIEQVKKLEANDGIKRFIPLDAQYRMPKTLGDLVSTQFYDGILRSPLGNEASFFGTDLKYIMGYHLAWLDVPGGIGAREIKNNNGSYCRPAEAERVVNMLSKIIQDSGEKAKQYKYGIMTFYNGQKEILQDLIRTNQVIQQSQISIDIGSVDAFQGMEYDIVFLSMVRSNTDYTHTKKRYGFTTDEHRLCVALSRAKRCMIIAGDSRMMHGKKAADAIPALKKFYDMCNDKEVTDARVFQDKNFSYQEEG
jgi:energy-coupling factor transporter ATP-binding protein EcfA2